MLQGIIVRLPEVATEDSRLVPGLVAARYGSEVLFLCVVWPLSICIFSLSLGRSGHQGLDPVSCQGGKMGLLLES